jgi:hypothetical protein
VRRSAKAKYGDRVLTSLDTVVEHILLDSRHHDLGLMSAAGEAWLFSLADAHVISEQSSFGKMGALLSAHWDSESLVLPRLPWLPSSTCAAARPALLLWCRACCGACRGPGGAAGLLRRISWALCIERRPCQGATLLRRAARPVAAACQGSRACWS